MDASALEANLFAVLGFTVREKFSREDYSDLRSSARAPVLASSLEPPC